MLHKIHFVIMCTLVILLRMNIFVIAVWKCDKGNGALPPSQSSTTTTENNVKTTTSFPTTSTTEKSVCASVNQECKEDNQCCSGICTRAGTCDCAPHGANCDLEKGMCCSGMCGGTIGSATCKRRKLSEACFICSKTDSTDCFLMGPGPPEPTPCAPIDYYKQLRFGTGMGTFGFNRVNGGHGNITYDVGITWLTRNRDTKFDDIFQDNGVKRILMDKFTKMGFSTRTRFNMSSLAQEDYALLGDEPEITDEFNIETGTRIEMYQLVITCEYYTIFLEHVFRRSCKGRGPCVCDGGTGPFSDCNFKAQLQPTPPVCHPTFEIE